MKINFFVSLIFICFFSISGTIAQNAPFNFKFQVSINGVSYGDYQLTTGYYGTLQKVNNSQPNLPTLCPGDEITLENKSVYQGNNHDFAGIGFPFKRPTIGLTRTAGCSNPPNNNIDILHLGDVCVSNSCNYASTLSTYQTFNNWNFNSSITVTLPYSSNSYEYLAIDAAGTSNQIGSCGCGHRVAYLRLNFGDVPTKLNGANICPNSVVNLNLDPDCTYSNWSPNNPNGNTLSATTNYTVDITNNVSGCTINDAFTISLQNPDVNLSIPRQLCYNQGIQITEVDFYGLYENGTSPSQILVNGVLIADANGTMNLPHYIGAPNYNPGIVTVEYVYTKGGITCSKIYQVDIQPEIVVNLQSSYGFCSGNFQPICATASGVAQANTGYIWRKAGVSSPVGNGVCFTPSSYGTYYLTAYGHFGCIVKRSFRVYNPGVGIQQPPNITFCSMTDRLPRYVGWSSDPFGAIMYGFNWTYTDQNGISNLITNTGAQYQVPYVGSGTYTAVVSANGCTETFTITVTDLLNIYTNHNNASFSIAPLSGNQISCQPSVSMSGTVDIWTVTNLSTYASVPTIPYGAGIRFAYSTGVEYSITLKREASKQCQIFINEFKWSDEANKRNRRGVIKDNVHLDLEPMVVNTFPNPTTGLVNIQLENMETKETSIEVLNTLGQIILQKQVQNKTNIEIDLSKEQSGIYMLHIVNGNTQFTEKVIKE